MRRTIGSGIALGFVCLAFAAYGPTFAQDDPKAKRREEKKAKQAGKKGNEDVDRVVLAFDPGSHARPISAMGFTKDRSKLVTVAWDYSIQIWSTRTGERLDIIRLPAYGRDNGIDAGRWNVAAISADGNYVAIGGDSKQIYDESGILTRLLLVDVPNKKVRKYIVGGGANSPVVGLSFSADGNRLAVASGGDNRSVMIVDDVHRYLRESPGIRRPSRPKPLAGEFSGTLQSIALTPSGDRLLAGELRGSVRAWDISGTDPDKWTKLAEFAAPDRTDALAWSPDGKQFARGWMKSLGGGNRGIEIRTATGEPVKRWTFLELSPGFLLQNTIATIRYLDADRIFASSHGQIGRGDGFGSVAAVVNVRTGTSIRSFGVGSDGMFLPVGAVSGDGILGATTTDLGLEATIFQLDDGKILARCGSRTPMPAIVGWSSDPKAPAFAWSDDATRGVTATKPSDLKYGFDLNRIRPIESFVPDNFELRRMKHGDWSIEARLIPNKFVDASAKNAATGSEVKNLGGQCVTLIPHGSDAPLVAYARHDFETQTGSFATIQTLDGKRVTNLFPVATRHRDMVPSPDGRYLLTSTGTHRLSIYKTDGSAFPFMNFVQANGEWILWTPEGYYAASPGGDRLIGWAITDGANEPARYFPAERYAKHFRRPDVLRLAFEHGSVDRALQILNAAAPDIVVARPSVATLALVEQRDGRAVVTATAQSGDKGRPITSVQLLLDGRPLAAGQGTWKGSSATVTETFAVEIPSGSHELKLLARTDDLATLSEPLALKGPRSATNPATLHRLCIGIGGYDDPALGKIATAAKDARDVYEALGTSCVGDANRFGAAGGERLIDKDATGDRIRKALADLRKRAKPGDLVAIYFAGYGLKTEKDYYLLTHESPAAGALEDRALSGQELKKALREFECPVLFLLDVRHSAAAKSTSRPATDDLARELCDETVGVTVLSAAMAHESAGGSAENGYFAYGLLKGLKAGRDGPYDPYERVLYANHLHMVAFGEVRRASKGLQNPFLHSPWTATPIALRIVPEK